jgi:hypothetical protein
VVLRAGDAARFEGSGSARLLRELLRVPVDGLSRSELAILMIV